MFELHCLRTADVLNAPCVWKKSHQGEMCHLQIIFLKTPKSKGLSFENAFI